MDATLAYEMNTGIIHLAVHNFSRKYGWGWDRTELLSDAHEFFMDAFTNWTPEGGASLTNLIYVYIWNGLLGKLRKRIEERKRYRNMELKLVAQTSQKEFDADEFLGHLSLDGETLTEMAFDMPQPIQRHLRQGTSRSSHTVQKAFKSYLKEFGWTHRRFQAAVAEVRETLKKV